jgi:hypothetical protein
MLNIRCIPDSLLLLVFVDQEEHHKPWEYWMESSGCNSVCNQNGGGCLEFALEKIEQVASGEILEVSSK